MKKMKFLTYAVLVLFLGFAISSCEGPAGPAGAVGADGVDGVDGTNGNANVTTIAILPADITWTADTYIGIPSNVFSLTETAVNQDIIDHGAVLGFSHLFVSGTYDEWVPLPFDYDTGTYLLSIKYTYSLNTINLYAYNTSGPAVPDGAFIEYHFLLITDNTVGGKSATTVGVLDELKNAGVDVNDYYAVCDYYDIVPK